MGKVGLQPLPPSPLLPMKWFLLLFTRQVRQLTSDAKNKVEKSNCDENMRVQSSKRKCQTGLRGDQWNNKSGRLLVWCVRFLKLQIILYNFINNWKNCLCLMYLSLSRSLFLGTILLKIKHKLISIGSIYSNDLLSNSNWMFQSSKIEFLHIHYSGSHVNRICFTKIQWNLDEHPFYVNTLL